MRNSLSKAILLGNALLSLSYEHSFAQPIQLVPNQGESVHTLSSFPEQKGFWEGTPPHVVETYFPKLPLHLASSSLRQLRDELIREKYIPLLQNPIYQETLFSLLVSEGKFEEVKELLIESSLPDKETLLLNLLWLSEPQKACEKVSNLIRTSSNLEWKKQNICCLYLNGERERGKIAAELLSESNPGSLPLLEALFDPSLEPSFESSVAKSPFLLRVWLETGKDIPQESIEEMSPSSLALIARSEKTPIKTRFLAAKKAFQEGINTKEVLEKATPDIILGKFSEALKSLTVEKLLPLFEEAQRQHKLELVAKVFNLELSRISPSLELLPLALFMIRAGLREESKDLAEKWGSLYMREAPDEAISILPLLYLAFPQTKWGPAQFQAWQVYQIRTHPEEIAAQNSYELRHILKVLEEPSGEPIKGEPQPLSWRQERNLFDEKDLNLLNSAAESKRKGEATLLILALIGETPLKDIPFEKFKLLLSALYKIGCVKEARSLALEYLLANDI